MRHVCHARKIPAHPKPQQANRYCVHYYTLHFWFQELRETLYISGSSNDLKKCTSLDPATTWDIVHKWIRQSRETMIVSGPRNHLAQCSFLVQTNFCETVNIWYQQLHEKLYITVSSNELRHCISPVISFTLVIVHLWTSNYLRTINSLDQANTWDTVDLCFQQLPETLYIFVPATTWGVLHQSSKQLPDIFVQFWSQQLPVTL